LTNRPRAEIHGRAAHENELHYRKTLQQLEFCPGAQRCFHTTLQNIFKEWSLTEQLISTMGVHRNFSRGAASTLCLSFLGFWRCNENGCSQKGLPLLHRKENAPCYGNSHKNALRWQQ